MDCLGNEFLARSKAMSLALFLMVVSVSSPAVASSFQECREFAREVSGFEGKVPAEYKRSGGALEGALKGAAAGSALAWLTDSDRKEAAKKGALLGGLIGALKKAEQDKKRKENAAKRRHYQRALEECMHR